MPHKWKRKHPEKKRLSDSYILEAVKMVSEEGKSVREVAKAMDISKSALSRHVKKYTETADKDSTKFQPNLTCGMIFSCEEEVKLRDYLLTASKMHYGLTTVQVRKLAYQYAIAVNKNCPKSWEENNTAGYDWFRGFMTRNHELSLRAPEATSLGRATSFNKTNVDSFLNNLRAVMEQYKLNPDCIYNCDETGFTSVNTPPRVVAARGEKQVGQVTSAERGETVTVLVTVNGIGNTVPPVFVYPRVRYKDFFLNGTPPGSLALPSRSGWMSSDLFVSCLEHIIKHTKCSIDHPILLILDNHESHVSIDVINKAKDNGVIMLTFPPHCSHRLQPLDVSVFSPLKSQYNRVCNDWLLNHPGKTISIYCVGELVGQAYPLAVTQKNIISGFKKTGIYPFNSEPFTEEEYLMSSVTDRPMQVETNVTSKTSSTPDDSSLPSTSKGDVSLKSTSRAPSTSGETNFPGKDPDGVPLQSMPTSRVSSASEETNIPGKKSIAPDNDSLQGSKTSPNPEEIHVFCNQSTKTHIEIAGNNAIGLQASSAKRNLSFEDILPFPKAEPLKSNKRGRKKGKSRILTSTPEKIEAEKIAAQRAKKKSTKTNTNRPKPIRSSAKRKNIDPDSETSSEDITMELEDSDDCMSFTSSGSSDMELDKINWESEDTEIKPGDFVLVRFCTKRSVLYYVGRVEHSECNELKVEFLRKKKGCWKFSFPEQNDTSFVDKRDVMFKLPNPVAFGGTERMKSLFTFKVNLTKYNVL